MKLLMKRALNWSPKENTFFLCTAVTSPFSIGREVEEEVEVEGRGRGKEGGEGK